MQTIATQQASAPAKAQCPRCGAKDGIHAGAGLAGRSGRKAYDIYSDTFGVLRCPHCGHRAQYAEFHKAPESK